MMDEMNGCDDFHLSPNSLLSTFETSIDEELNFAFSQMVDNNDPWIGNGICDQINIFGHDMFDEDFNTGLKLFPNKSSIIGSFCCRTHCKSLETFK